MTKKDSGKNISHAIPPDVWSRSLRVLSAKDGKLIRDRLKLVSEMPLTILLNSEEIVTLLCVPDAPRFLAVGFLFSEGIIEKVGNIKSIEEDTENGRVMVTAETAPRPAETLRKRIVTTGCGKGTTFSYGIEEHSIPPFSTGFTVDLSTIFSLMKELSNRSHLYEETRGTHNSALASVYGIEVFHADVGRHNAVDKIYGQCLLEGISTEDKLMVTTGRLTSEIIIKCARMGIPHLISRHAATSLAVDLANQLNMTLVGYVRGSRLTVYSGFDRIRE